MQKKYTLDTCSIINIQYDDVLMEGISFHGDSKSMNDRYPRPQSNIRKVYKHVRYPAFSVWYNLRSLELKLISTTSLFVHLTGQKSQLIEV